MNKTKVFLLLTTAILMYNIHPIWGYTSGELYTVTNISKCFGDYNVKVRSTDGIIDDEYSIVDCANKDNLWTCSCKDDGNDVQILTDIKTTNVYDITVEYYLAPLTNDNITNDSNKRTLQFTNIGFKSVKKIEPFKMPELEGGGTILIVIGSIILLIGLGIFLLWKFVFKGEGDISDRQMDKEIDDYVEKYSK